MRRGTERVLIIALVFTVILTAFVILILTGAFAFFPNTQIIQTPTSQQEEKEIQNEVEALPIIEEPQIEYKTEQLPEVTIEKEIIIPQEKVEDKVELEKIPREKEARFNIYSEMDLNDGIITLSGYTDRALITFPDNFSDSNIDKAIDKFFEFYKIERKIFPITLNNKTATIFFDKEYSDEEVADLFVSIIKLIPELNKILIESSEKNQQEKVEEKAIKEATEITPSPEQEIERIYSTPTWIEEDEDFWADFYIAGEDELLFEDGLYYMDLYINNELRGNIAVEMIAQQPYLSTAELKLIITESLIPEAYERIFMGRGETMTLEELDSVGVDSTFDSENYRIYLDFTLSDMPITVISISSPRKSLFTTRPISGATNLKPAVFSLKSSYSGTFSWSLYNKKQWNYALSLYSSNTASIFNTFLDYSYNMSYSKNRFNFNLSSYTFRHDFTDKMLRLSWGNVPSGLLSPIGTPIGIKISKSTAYSNDSYIRKSPYEAMITLDKESLVEVINEDRTIYSKVLSPGNYRLEDFVLYTGVNRVLIRISPTDGTTPKEMIKEFSYYSSLLYPGEFYYNLSITTGREKLSAKKQFRNGASGFSLFGNYYQYDPRNIAISFDFRYGISHSLLLSSGIAISNMPSEKNPFNLQGKLNFELTHANVLGTTRYNLNLTEKRQSNGIYGLPQIYARIGHQASTGLKGLSSINGNISFSSSNDYSINDRNIVNIGIGISGRLGFIGYSLSSSFNIYSDKAKESPYSAYLGISLSPMRNMSISSSLNLNGDYSGNVRLSGSIYASISFDSGSVSTSVSEKNSNINLNLHSNEHSFSAALAMPGYQNLEAFKEWQDYGLSASYSTGTKYFNFGVGFDSSLDFDSINGSLSLSTSTIFADGYFALASSIPSSYLLLRQKGTLKGNDITAGYGSSSSINKLPTTFGTAIYSGLSSAGTTDVMIYSMGENTIAGPTAFALSIPPTNGRGFVYTLQTEALYTVTAIATTEDNKLWTNGSSPLYKVKMIDESNIELIQDEDNYIFTDETGRFILSDITAGLYAFDIPTDDGWTLALIDVKENEINPTEMNMYKEIKRNIDIELPEQYTALKHFIYTESLSSEAFWALIYPSFEEII